MAHVAFLMPGQGAQAVGMGKAFYDRFASSRELYQQANRAFGFDVAALCFEGPQEELTKTEKCQPALFTTSLAAHAAVRELAPSLTPIGIAGLSLGELTSLALAEAMKLSDAFYLVQARAEAMAECTAHHQGAMLAVVGLTQEAINNVCAKSGASVSNYNSQDQLVLSGTLQAIDQAAGLAKAAGAKRAIKLDVAGAFHSPLMQPAADAFAHAVSKVFFCAPRVPIISNVTALPIATPAEISELQVRQIVSPVLWEPSMRYLIEQGATHFIEFPPSRVLTGLLRRIDSTVKGYAVDTPDDLEKCQSLFEK